MLHFLQKLPEFNPVAAGRKASLKFPNGPTYRQAIIQYKTSGTAATEGQMLSDIDRVALKINGIVRWEATGKQLLMLNKYYHEAGFKNGELIIDFTRSWARTKEGEENLAWGTRNVNSIFLEVKLNAAATSPELSADAIITPDSRDLGLIVECHDFGYDTSTTGKKEIPDLPIENGSLVALHLDNSDITALELKINKVPYIEDDTDLTSYQRYLERVGKRTPQTGITHVDALALNRLDDAWTLSGVSTFNVNPTVSAAGSIPILMETLSQPLGPARTAS